MKHLFTLILATLISVAGYAQSETLEQALTRIANLETTVNTQSQQLSKISSDLEAVLAQNLSLKKNLKLKPTIAKSKIFDALEYRVLDVIGDRSTGSLYVTMTVENIGNDDVKRTYSSSNEFIDELGNGYNNKDRYQLKIEGIADGLGFKEINHHVNVPLTIKLTIKKYNPDSNYLKYMAISLLNESLRQTQAVFENLPIKWVEEIED